MLNGFLGAANTYVPPSTPPSTPKQSDIDHLEHRLDALELACAGMWLLLKTKHGYSDQELVQAIQAMDARDGQIDGKMTPQQVNCPNCGRPSLTRQRNKCLWCGQLFITTPF